MSNHITNRLTITAKNLDTILVEIKGEGEDSFIDFDKIVPMPKELKGTTSPPRIVSQAEYDKETARINNGELTEIEKQFGLSRSITEKISVDLTNQFGSNNWYDWSIAKWGTKWNAYSQHINDNVIEFDTAWSTPFDVMVALSKKYHDATFKVEYADEDIGSNTGWYVLQNGEVLQSEKFDGDKDGALEFAIEIKGDDYYLGDFLCEENEMDNFIRSCVKLAHKKSMLLDDYTPEVLNLLKELALADEQYERVSKIDKLLTK
jgi:hypothetical protein